jgi:hypothetical protein
MTYDIEVAAGRKKTNAGKLKWTAVTERDYVGYLAVLIFTSLVRLPDMQDYWANCSGRLECPTVRAIMSVKRFWLWRRFLYFADRRHKVGRGDYSQPAPPGYDILHNWRTMQELHNKSKSWLSMVMVAKKLALDEMMTKCAT